MRLLLTRPRIDAETLDNLLKKIGIQSVIEPLLSINVFDGPELDCDDVAALAITSVNGVRAFAKRSQNRSIPLFAVGDSTARAAKSHGFTNVHSAAGAIGELATLITRSLAPSSGKILHPAASHIAGDLDGHLTEAGFSYQREIIYEAITAHRFSPEVVKQIQAKEIDGVVLFSPRTGYTFKALAKKARLLNDLSSIRAYCLSLAVTKTVKSLSWLEVHTAAKPTQAALLDLLDRSHRKSKNLK